MHRSLAVSNEGHIHHVLLHGSYISHSFIFCESQSLPTCTVLQTSKFSDSKCAHSLSILPFRLFKWGEVGVGGWGGSANKKVQNHFIQVKRTGRHLEVAFLALNEGDSVRATRTPENLRSTSAQHQFIKLLIFENGHHIYILHPNKNEWYLCFSHVTYLVVLEP